MPNLIPIWLHALINRYRYRKPTTPEQTLNTFKNGVREIDQGHPKKAIQYFTQAINASPGSAKLHHYRADAHALNNDDELAIIDFDIAVRLNPSYPDTYLDRGNSHYRLGQLEIALKDFSEAIRLKPAWSEAHGNRAVIHIELGNTEKAESDIKAALKLGINEAHFNEMLEIARTGANPPS